MSEQYLQDVKRIHQPMIQTDDELRYWLCHHERQIVEANRRYGHDKSRSAKSLIDEAYSKAIPYQAEAKRRGITSSALYDALAKMSDRTLKTLYRSGKQRMPHLFGDPKAMITLRNVCQCRGLFDE